MSTLDIKVEHHGSVAVIVLNGPLDSYTSTLFNEIVMKCIDDGHHQVVANLEHMNMLTSAGIGELAGAFNDLDEQGGELCLAALPEQAARAMEQLALLDMFEVFPDTPSAIAQFG